MDPMSSKLPRLSMVRLAPAEMVTGNLVGIVGRIDFG